MQWFPNILCNCLGTVLKSLRGRGKTVSDKIPRIVPLLGMKGAYTYSHTSLSGGAGNPIGPTAGLRKPWKSGQIATIFSITITN